MLVLLWRGSCIDLLSLVCFQMSVKTYGAVDGAAQMANLQRNLAGNFGKSWTTARSPTNVIISQVRPRWQFAEVKFASPICLPSALLFKRLFPSTLRTFWRPLEIMLSFYRPGYNTVYWLFFFLLPGSISLFLSHSYLLPLHPLFRYHFAAVRDLPLTPPYLFLLSTEEERVNIRDTK